MRRSRFVFVAALLIMALAVGFAVTAQDDVIEIEYWQYNFEARVTAMDMLIEQFEAENPNIRVIHNSDIPYDNFRDELAASAPAGVGPDVVSLFYGWIPAFVDAGYLVPLPEEYFPAEWIESYFSPMVAQSKFEGEYWAIPTAVRTLALFWNKDLFEAAGLDPEQPPTTLDEFVEMAQALTTYDGSGTDILNITSEGYAAQISGQAHHWFREVLLRQYGGVPYDEENRTVLYNSEEGCQAFAYLTAFETDYKTGSNDLFTDATQAFINGQEALHIDGSFRIGTIAANNPDLNYGVAELPVGPNGEHYTFGSYWTHGITRRAAADPARLEAAAKFLQFITTADAGTLWVNNVGELPAQLEAASDPALLEDPILGAFAAGLEYSYATFFVDESAQRQVMMDAFDQVRLAGMDPCDALNEAAIVEQELLDDYWAGRDE
ncbi:MAG: extracellular solute-binding protein [Anaerolineae bacterium]|nr:extracellular solute-binding protein [Anaerolineae bacterium]MCA9893097.1 extracellular solute-binding protein [Anaerolineae bacterium]MCB9459784.1 extracellular solute-binding protein [Anaerolineaceae bacterium]